MASIVIGVIIIKNPIFEGVMVGLTMVAWFLYGVLKKEDTSTYYTELNHTQTEFFIKQCGDILKPIPLESFVFRITFVDYPKGQRGLTYFLGIVMVMAMAFHIMGMNNFSVPLVYTYTVIIALITILRGWVRLNQSLQITKLANRCKLDHGQTVFYLRKHYSSYHKTRYVK